jgi:hypothetical protein
MKGPTFGEKKHAAFFSRFFGTPHKISWLPDWRAIFVYRSPKKP